MYYINSDWEDTLGRKPKNGDFLIYDSSLHRIIQDSGNVHNFRFSVQAETLFYMRGANGATPEIRDVDGVMYWYINGVNTGVVAGGTRTVESVTAANDEELITVDNYDPAAPVVSSTPALRDAIYEIGNIDERLDNVESLIPNEASPDNQLADKDYVNGLMELSGRYDNSIVRDENGKLFAQDFVQRLNEAISPREDSAVELDENGKLFVVKDSNRTRILPVVQNLYYVGLGYFKVRSDDEPQVGDYVFNTNTVGETPIGLYEITGGVQNDNNNEWLVESSLRVDLTELFAGGANLYLHNIFMSSATNDTPFFNISLQLICECNGPFGLWGYAPDFWRQFADTLLVLGYTPGIGAEDTVWHPCGGAIESPSGRGFIVGIGTYPQATDRVRLRWVDLINVRQINTYTISSLPREFTDTVLPL